MWNLGTNFSDLANLINFGSSDNERCIVLGLIIYTNYYCFEILDHFLTLISKASQMRISIFMPKD